MDGDNDEIPTLSDSDDYDARNDETFGNETEEFKWENTPAYEFLYDEPKADDLNGVPNHNREIGDSMKVNLLYEDGEFEFENEKELEANVSRLVMEECDYDDTEGQAAASGGQFENKSMNQPAFIPSQVTNRHYRWSGEEEARGDSSLLAGSSVWSKPRIDPSQAWKQKYVYADSPAVKVKTVYEIKLEVLGEAQPPRPPPEKTPFGPTSAPLLFNKPSYLPYAIGMPPSKVNAGPPFGHYADEVDQSCPPTSNSQSTQPRNQPRNVEVQDNQQPQHSLYHINEPLGHGRGSAFSAVSSPVFPASTSRRGIGLAYQIHMRDSGESLNMMPPRMSGQSHSNDINEYRPGRWMRRGNNDWGKIMTDQDKRRLRIIQMVQLQNDHPHTVDYYYQMKFLKDKEITVDGRRDYACFKKLYPGIDTEHARNNYQPTHFENSLGKIQAVSALAPKRAIDTPGVVSVETVNSWRSPARSTLLWIERIYSKVLKVEEADFRATLTLRKTGSLFLAREEDLAAALGLLEFVGVEDIAKYNKGKVLISRIVGLMLPDRNHDLFKYVIMNLGNWFNSESEKHEARVMYESIRNVILSRDISELSYFFELLKPTEKAVNDILKSKIGFSVVLCLLHKIEEAFDSNGEFIWNGEQINIPQQISEPLYQYIHLTIFSTKPRLAFEVFPSLLSLVKRCKVRSGNPEIEDVILCKNRMDFYVRDGAKIYKG